MKKSDFSYELPDELIARYPSENRIGSRLLGLLSDGRVVHSEFRHVLDFLRPTDLLVFNNTRVVPARLFGHKASGGKVEILIERFVEDGLVVAQIKSSKSPKPGSLLLLEDDTQIEVIGREGSFFVISAKEPWYRITERLGHIPLPPYIDREDAPEDIERYQTVYAKKPGAVAAPTAGLHFDLDLLQRITDLGIGKAEVTLHVGAGTYQPVRADNLKDHRMHSEWISVDADVCSQINRVRAKGGRIVAVGTTAMRTLESLPKDEEGSLRPYVGDTDIFIYPGYEFGVVDAMITNFHLSESSLLMLVSAFSGCERIRSAYQQAIEKQYRFFSYGDAMFLEKNPNAPEDMPK